ncbi:hypothetical protein BGZ57DRAFT_953700 [Hyaloscypha finlandica]|nr:hypothetical protein BGZ57DRAFT_953700 [Hyaloscypha finlandica]
MPVGQLSKPPSTTWYLPTTVNAPSPRRHVYGNASGKWKPPEFIIIDKSCWECQSFPWSNLYVLRWPREAGDRELVTYLNTEISNQLRGFVENTGGIPLFYDYSKGKTGICAGQACYTGPNWREQFYKTRHEVFDRITLGLMTEDEIPVTMQKKWAATSKIPGGWVVFRAQLLKVRTPPQSPLASAVQSTVLRSVPEAPQIEDIPVMTTNTTDLEDTTASAYPFLGHLMPSHTWRDIAEVSSKSTSRLHIRNLY